jgi:hypothetical protein
LADFAAQLLPLALEHVLVHEASFSQAECTADAKPVVKSYG